ncbi:hypothetical protein [Mycolicibacterium bacteremicum]|uniref:Uncharacterized protein n=1 Tax=Mycolicibacterium bacteremicum TaxID=564198 RepID=A0A1W9Z4J3_MYCBA|nr:hypothetical protein [Mycolicibacterium bacteremicum]MCV7433704.1 hypothetical protein [Mycolicibacterium bacteremicum]ORA07256.1 hypothetical protein BST17_01985 [Mycolicibacterium bacteremicum]
MSAKTPEKPEDPRIGYQSHELLRQALESAREHVAAAADASKAAMTASEPEVAQARRAARRDEPEGLQAIANTHHGHGQMITTSAAEHSKAIDDLILDLAELFNT